MALVCEREAEDEGRIRELRQQLADVQLALSALQQSNKNTVDKRIAAEKTQQTMETELTRLRTDVAELRQKLVDTENKFTSVKHKYDDLKRKYTDCKQKHKYVC
jgi:chromosome segregation ATPase